MSSPSFHIMLYYTTSTVHNWVEEHFYYAAQKVSPQYTYKKKNIIFVNDSDLFNSLLIHSPFLLQN